MRRPPWLSWTAAASLLLILAALAARPGLAQKSEEHPNILFIYTDDQRWDAMGIAGHPFLKTPNIDRVGREGGHFRNAFVTTPLCSPSRSSFLTGQYVHTTGIRGNTNAGNARSHQLITFPRLLHDAGYESSYVGKLHMGNDDSPRPGFDHWVSFKGQGQYLNPQINVNGQAGRVDGYITDILTDHAVRFLKQPRTKPFCMVFGHKAVHGPFTPAERHKSLYTDEPLPRAPNVKDTLEGKPALTRPIDGQPAVRAGGGSGEALIRSQLRCLASVDESVGQLLKALEDTKQLDNTLVIFTSDNGYFWGEHSLGDKRWAYEESIRIPLVMRYPKLIKAGTKLDQMVLNIDIAPTVLELGGAPIPEAMHGRSLLPLFRNPNAPWRKGFLAEYFLEPGFPRHPSWQAVRTDRWKYIHYTELQGMDELYDLKADRYEMKNLIGDPAAAGPLRDLKADLEKQLRDTGAS